MYPLERFRTHCRRLQRLSTVLAVGLGLLLLAPLPAGLLQWLLRHTTGGWSAQNLLLYAVHLLPGLCFAWALWAVRGTLRELAAGQLFQPAVARGLRRVGYAVTAGALLELFAVTNLARLITHGHGSYAMFDPAGIALAIVGATLVLLARLVEQAERMREELDEIF